MGTPPRRSDTTDSGRQQVRMGGKTVYLYQGCCQMTVCERYAFLQKRQMVPMREVDPHRLVLYCNRIDFFRILLRKSIHGTSMQVVQRRTCFPKSTSPYKYVTEDCRLRAQNLLTLLVRPDRCCCVYAPDGYCNSIWLFSFDCAGDGWHTFDLKHVQC